MNTQSRKSRRSLRSLSMTTKAFALAAMASAAPLGCSGSPEGADEQTGTGSSAYSTNPQVASNVASFVASGPNDFYFIDTSGNLYQGFWRNGSASSAFISSGVKSVTSLAPGDVYFVDTNNVLWHQFPTLTGIETMYVDGNVVGARPVPGSSTGYQGQVLVHGSDNKLWYTIGTNANRQLIDGNVYGSQAMDSSHVYVLGTDGNLWLEEGPFGNGTQGYTTRYQVDSNVQAFHAVDNLNVYVLDKNATLWNETANGGPAPTSSQRYWVDGSVERMFPVDTHTVYVQGTDSKLWQEASNMNVRTFTDSGLQAFQPLSDTLVYVQWNGLLLRETMPQAPLSFQMPTGGVLDSSSTVWMWPNGNYEFVGSVSSGCVFGSIDYSIAWGIEDVNGNTHEFAKSGSFGCNVGGGAGTSFDTGIKNDPRIKNDFAALKQWNFAKWDVQESTDWAGTLHEIEQIISTVKTIASIIIIVAG